MATAGKWESTSNRSMPKRMEPSLAEKIDRKFTELLSAEKMIKNNDIVLTPAEKDFSVTQEFHLLPNFDAVIGELKNQAKVIAEQTKAGLCKEANKNMAERITYPCCSDSEVVLDMVHKDLKTWAKMQGYEISFSRAVVHLTSLALKKRKKTKIFTPSFIEDLKITAMVLLLVLGVGAPVAFVPVSSMLYKIDGVHYVDGKPDRHHVTMENIWGWRDSREVPAEYFVEGEWAWSF